MLISMENHESKAWVSSHNAHLGKKPSIYFFTKCKKKISKFKYPAQSKFTV